MDNVTHSIAGLLLAEAAVQLRRSRTPMLAWPTSAFQTSAALASVLASNLPDGDLLYSRGKLGYLLHHRGHTHTVLVALLLAPVAWAVALLVWRLVFRRDAPPTPADRWWMLGLCIVGTLSHVGFDALNSYGVHPFWPIDDRWYYGDTLFILEPWLWVIAVPPLLLATRRASLRLSLGFVLLAGLAATWLVSFVPWGVALALTIGVGASMALAHRIRPTVRAGAALAGWLLVTLLFLAGSRAARAEVMRAARASAATTIADVVITPAVSNPLCHDVLVVETNEALYRVRAATVASFPALLPARRCGVQPRGASPVMRRSARVGTPGVRWDAEWSGPLPELVALDRENCIAAAALRFMRAPAWYPIGADSLHLGDLRYDRGEGAGFAEIVVPRRPAPCPRSVPPWVPPRRDILRTR